MTSPSPSALVATELANRLLAWYTLHARDLPWRRTSDPYGIWISEIMCQQTQVKTVIPYWERWMKRFPTIQSLATAPEQGVLKAWEGLGYYSRARNLQRTAQIIVEEHKGRFPSIFPEVLALPGIGRYTAGAICSLAFGQPTPILDGNVARVLSRAIGIAGDTKSNSTREQLWAASAALVQQAPDRPGALNQSLMELGALVCIPRQPLCGVCPIRLHCYALQHGQTAALPQSAARPKARQRLFLAFILEHRDKVLIRQRPTGQVNAGLWEFPNFEPTRKRGYRGEISERLGFTPANLLPFVALKHSITTSRITLRSFRAELNGEAKAAATALNATWLPRRTLRDLPFTAAHAKLRGAFLQERASSATLEADN